MIHAPLARLPTPLEPMTRLGEWLGLPRLLVKRDDLTGLALGGNKARKLERLCADAMGTDCDVLVTGGGTQSNHARMTAAAARHIGLGCHLVLDGPSPDRKTANLLLDQLFGATLHFTGDALGYYGLEAAIERAGAELAVAGRHPYVIPIGGASVPGVVAYVEAAAELIGQLDIDGLGPADSVVVADGSGGTHAGLLAGLDASTRVVGVDVGTRPDLDDVVPRLAAEAAAVACRDAPQGAVIVDHGRFGDGYGALTDASVEALRETARLEGLILDPVYTSKAMAGLIGWVREGRIGPNDTVIFWHTGGAVALFAERYADVLSAL